MTKEEIQDLYLLLKSGNDVGIAATTLKKLLDDFSEQAEEIDSMQQQHDRDLDKLGRLMLVRHELEEEVERLKELLENADWLFHKYILWGPDEGCALAVSWREGYKAAKEQENELLKAENEHYEMASSGYCLNGCESPVFLLRLDRANQRIEALLNAIDRYRQKLLHTGNKDSLTLKNAVDADEIAAARRDYK